MSTLTMGLADARNNFSRVTAEVNRTGRPVTVLKNNEPRLVIQPASAPTDAVDFMEKYADVFKELTK